MKPNIRKSIKNQVNSLLNYFDLELIRPSKEFENYIGFKETIKGAKSAGLSVGDYIDFSFNVPGASQLTIDKMVELGVFRKEIRQVCEIGPGSGRYVDKTIEICHPHSYEIYETAKEWRNWLKARYNVIAHEADGKTLANTASCSVDIVQAHKVFPGLRVFGIIGYLSEMVRICKLGGYIVFDVLTEECLGSELLTKWIESGVSWPCAVIPVKLLIDFLTSHGIELIGSFTIPMKPGITHYFVLQKPVESSKKA